MRVMSPTELLVSLDATLDQVAAGHEPVLITRDGGEPTAVLISIEDYASWEETSYLLRSPENRRQLLDAITDLDAGKGEFRDLID